MPLSATPQVTASLTLNSPNLLNDALSLSVTSKLYKAGTSESLAETSGLARTAYGAVTDEPFYAAADYTASPMAAKLYVKNTSTVNTDYVEITIGSTNVVLGRLYGGDFAFIPWMGTEDLDITTSAALTIESMLIHES